LIYKFGDFELDPSRFELRRNGRVQKLERIPMELLILLAEKEGKVATRQEIVERLWGKEVFVDTEHGINTAVRKIRQALRDDPDEPRFVQTVTGKGYRFVAEKNGDSGAMPAAVEVAPAQPAAVAASPVVVSKPASKSRGMIWPAAAVVVVVVAGVVAGFNVGGVRDRLFPGSRARQIHSIAVLPLNNLSGDASQEYFADGMTDEVITMLAKNTSLRVVSRTSVMQYKGVKRPLPEIARELGVDGILEGSIERLPNSVHMTVQLIYAPTDTHVWAARYDRDLNAAVSLPSELSETIAKEVKSATSTAPRQRAVNPEAHDAYLHGRYFWFTFNVANTLPYFQKAIELQPDYAAAWSGLADTYAVDGMMNHPPREVTEKVHAAALKAIELDPSLAEAHNSLAAWYLFYAWDPGRAEVESRRAVELNPNYAEGYHVLSYVLEVQNRYAEGEAAAKRSVELDPFIHPWELGSYYTTERRFDDAIQELKMRIVAHPNDADIRAAISKTYWLRGMYQESQQEYEQSLELQHDSATQAAAHKAWVSGGETAVEHWGAERIKALASKQYVETDYVASTIAFTGDKDETMKYLEASYREHDPDLIFIQNEPLFDFLHSDPRYQALVKKMGLTLAE